MSVFKIFSVASIRSYPNGMEGVRRTYVRSWKICRSDCCLSHGQPGLSFANQGLAPAASPGYATGSGLYLAVYRVLFVIDEYFFR